MKIKPIVLINGIDKTSRVTGNLIINPEESMARIATFSLLPEAGITDLIGWVGQSVVIKSVIDSVEKIEFTGIIDTPIFDIKTGLTAFNCTDNLQELFETKTKSEIDIITGGYWSEAVFNDSEGWDYATDRMSTMPSALDYDAELNTRVTAWAAKVTPDFIITAVIDGTLNVDQISKRRNIINNISINLEYRYTRLKERKLLCNLDDGLSDNQYVCKEGNYVIPKKELIISAIEKTNWELLTDIVWLEVPIGTFTCAGPPIYDINSVAAPAYARGAEFTLGKRYSQNVTEKYTIEILSVDSIAKLGDIKTTEAYSLVTNYDKGEWDTSSIKKGWDEYGTPLYDVNNDGYANQDSSTSRQNAIDTAINKATTKILSTHRQNRIRFSLPFNQGIDLVNTVAIDTPQLSAKGKVTNVVKTINMADFNAVTDITISLSKSFGTGIESPDTPATIPDGLPVNEDAQTVELALNYHLGGHDDTVYSELWAGWTTDYIPTTEPGHIPYPTELNINTPAITLNSIDNIEPENSSEYNVSIPDDILQ